MVFTFISPILPSSSHPPSRCIPKCCQTPPDPLTYAASGVDISLETRSVTALLSALGPPALSPPTRGALLPTTSSFSGLLSFGDAHLALCTDGVGSKLLLAEAMSNYTTIAQDLVAMNVNDLLCLAATPLAFVDYIAAPAPDPAIWQQLGASLGEACRLARVSLAGGESASLPGLVTGLEISGTALGWVPAGMQIDGTAVKPGDAIIGLPASGVHSNGYSLVRTIVDRSASTLTDPAPFIADGAVPRADGPVRDGDGVVSLGDVLLNPTKIYVDPVSDLLAACREGAGPCEYANLHGLAHITGGGLSNLLRLSKGLGFSIDNPLPVLPEFEWLRDAGGVQTREMYRTFNMGMGMALVVEREVAPAVAAWLDARLGGTRVVGSVDSSGVVTHAAGVVFTEY